MVNGEDDRYFQLLKQELDNINRRLERLSDEMSDMRDDLRRHDKILSGYRTGVKMVSFLIGVAVTLAGYFLHTGK